MKRAAICARQHHAALSLLPVVSRNPLEALARLYGPAVPEFEKKHSAAVSAQLRQTAELRHSHYGIEVVHHLATGSAHIEISACATARGVDLIVVGKHGTTEIKEALLGSVSKHVAYEAGCDMLMAG